MTNSNGNRLDRIEALVEANSRNIATNTAIIAELGEDIAQLREIVETNSHDIATNTQSIRQLATIAQTQQQTIREVTTILVEEIRGLRAENRRILTYLFGPEA